MIANETYLAALELVAIIDDSLRPGNHHTLWYDSAGELLFHLDQVVNAILNDELDLEKARARPLLKKRWKPSYKLLEPWMV